MKNQISVIVCTYNRPELFELCLNSLTSQTVKQKNFEIIVIDNYGSKTTKKIVNKYKDKDIKYYIEKKTGLSFARNTGYKKAKNKYVAYIDDDAIAEKDWVENIIKFINTHPKVKIFGGPYERYSLVSIPSWIPDKFGNNKLSNKEKKLNPKKEWLTGSNIIIEKNLLDNLGGFNTNFGMKGKKIGYGEETELQTRILDMGIDMYYSPKIKVKHLFDQRKHNLKWMIKNTYISGKYGEKSEAGSRTTLQRLIDIFKGIINIFYWLFKPQKMPCKLRIFKSLEKIIYEIGSFQ